MQCLFLRGEKVNREVYIRNCFVIVTVSWGNVYLFCREILWEEIPVTRPFRREVSPREKPGMK